jgi:hypothetical protein
MRGCFRARSCWRPGTSEVLLHRAWGVADLSSGRPVTVDTVYDLASLTKPLATTLAVMRLIQTGRLTLDDVHLARVAGHGGYRQGRGDPASVAEPLFGLAGLAALFRATPPAPGRRPAATAGADAGGRTADCRAGTGSALQRSRLSDPRAGGGEYQRGAPGSVRPAGDIPAAGN